jgi:Protein of unknown function (DUF2783)
MLKDLPVFENRITAPDDFYQALLDVHQGLALAASHALNARLVLILANAVGDMPTLLAALQLAAATGDEAGDETQPAPDTTRHPTP